MQAATSPKAKHKSARMATGFEKQAITTAVAKIKGVVALTVFNSRFRMTGANKEIMNLFNGRFQSLAMSKKENPPPNTSKTKSEDVFVVKTNSYKQATEKIMPACQNFLKK